MYKKVKYSDGSLAVVLDEDDRLYLLEFENGQKLCVNKNSCKVIKNS